MNTVTYAACTHSVFLNAPVSCDESSAGKYWVDVADLQTENFNCSSIPSRFSYFNFYFGLDSPYVNVPGSSSDPFDCFTECKCTAVPLLSFYKKCESSDKVNEENDSYSGCANLNACSLNLSAYCSPSGLIENMCDNTEVSSITHLIPTRNFSKIFYR